MSDIFNPSAGGSGGVAIGGLVTGGTPGSILFIDGSTNLAQDNNNFFISDTSNASSNIQLSFGTGGDKTGSDTINIYYQGDAYLPNSIVNGGSGQAANLLLDGLIPGWTASSSQGTGTSPIISNTGDFIGAFGAWMYTGASPAYTPAGLMLGVARGATAANLGGELQFWTKVDNGALTQRWTIGNDGGLVGTSAVAQSFALGQNGATNPVFQIDSSIASQATGLSVQGKAAGSQVSLSVLSTGTNEGLQINTKGSGSIFLQCGGTTRATIGTTQWLFSLLTASSAITPRFLVLNTSDTTLTASTECPFAYFNMANGARGHATGNVTLQRDFRISGSTHTFAGASSITDLAAFSVDYGSVGGNVTATNIHAIYIPTTAITGLSIANSYGLTINAASGATNNFAAQFLGGATVFTGAMNSNMAGTVLNGTTAGTVTSYQALQGTALKIFTAVFAGYENNSAVSQTISFPVAFTGTPVVVGNNTGITITATTTTLTIVTTNNTTVFNGTITVTGV